MASSSSTTVAVPPWLELPREITAKILQKLGQIEMITTAEKVCTAWRSVCRDPSMWRCIHMRFGERRYGIEKLCRNAVDRSQGQLIDINIEYFGSDYLLLYIAQRSKCLRRLQIVSPHTISVEAMIEAVKHFPLLEELQLYHTNIDAETIEAIGRSCPLLKTFKLNNRWYRRYNEGCDLKARAIAGNMPELRHLQLFGNRMTNEGLQAIIDGCPNLESLDLRQCFNVQFGGDIGRLCSQRIKDLRRPHDPTDDYRFDAEVYDYESSDEDYMAEMLGMIANYDDHYDDMDMDFSLECMSSIECDDEDDDDDDDDDDDEDEDDDDDDNADNDDGDDDDDDDDGGNDDDDDDDEDDDNDDDDDDDDDDNDDNDDDDDDDNDDGDDEVFVD